MNLKNIILTLLAMFLTISVVQAKQQAIEIYTCDDLQGIGSQTGPMNAEYIQMQDIDCAHINSFSPIGNDDNPFMGQYNGQNYSITNLTVYNIINVGLFGHISYASIDNVVLTDVSISGGDYADVGALVGSAYDSIIRNCHVNNGTVQGVYVVGGLIGGSYFSGGVYNSSAQVNVLSSAQDDEWEISFGGLIGEAFVEVYDSFATGNVTSGIAENTGGLIGWSYDLVKNSYATGDVFSDGHYIASPGIGGLVGSVSSGDIENSYATGNVNQGIYYASVGGLVGDLLSANIDSSYATGNVEGSVNVGGLVGFWNEYADETISNSYASGMVLGNKMVGGLIGIAESQNSTVINSYASGFVAAGSQEGGLIGFGGTQVINSYWDIQTSGQRTSFGGEGRTTDEMKLLDTSEPTYVDWNESIWAFEIGQYPTLR